MERPFPLFFAAAGPPLPASGLGYHILIRHLTGTPTHPFFPPAHPQSGSSAKLHKKTGGMRFPPSLIGELTPLHSRYGLNSLKPTPDISIVFLTKNLGFDNSNTPNR